MKFSRVSLTLCLLTAASTQAFTVPTRSTRSTRIFSSTLEKPDTATDEAQEKKEESDLLAVSANHVVINGRIAEGGLISSEGITSPNLVKPLTFEEEPLPSVAHESSSSFSSPHQNSNSAPEEPVNLKSTQGIKMASVEDAKKLTGDEEAMKRKAEEMRQTKLQSEEKATSNSSATSFSDKMANSGVASAAAMATAAVNAAVAMKTLEAPDVQKSYIALDNNKELDEDGLPLVYDKDAIETYWKKERGALNKRWGVFVGKAVPFLTRLTTLFIKDGKIDEQYIPELSERARIDLQDLGPTFIKAGQMMSVRPDVLPQSTLDELTKLQDSVIPFPTSVAVEQIERELGGPLGQFFTSISEEPVAAASLAQVYLATLNDGKDTRVAVKVQRPDVLSTVSKDLYVLRRAAEVFQGLVERFAPQQKTNYVALLNEWSIGFYTELDFQNEARNQQRLRDALKERGIKGVTVPKVYEDMCTRRILVSQWMDGQKLSSCSDEEIGQLIPMCQEAFLTQLFEVGFFHADPHRK